MKVQYNSLNITKGFYSPFPLSEELKDYTNVDLKPIEEEIDAWIESAGTDSFQESLESYKSILLKLGAQTHGDTGKRLYHAAIKAFGEKREIIEEYIIFLMRSRLRSLGEQRMWEMRSKMGITPTKELYLKMVMIFGKLVSISLVICC